MLEVEMTEAKATAARAGLGDQIFTGVDTWLALNFRIPDGRVLCW
jgi:hypothetical protein